MRFIFHLLLPVLFTLTFFDSSGQQRADSSAGVTKSDSTITIVLVRHAEKDTIGGDDPDLSPAGIERAKKLRLSLKEIMPDEFYSTPFKRTKQTLTPWSEYSGKEIKIYDPKNPEGFAQQLKALKGKSVVVAGHSNTIPVLVNLLLGSAKYKALDDSVYNKIFVVTIKSGAASDRIIEY